MIWGSVFLFFFDKFEPQCSYFLYCVLNLFWYSHITKQNRMRVELFFANYNTVCITNTQWRKIFKGGLFFTYNKYNIERKCNSCGIDFFPKQKLRLSLFLRCSYFFGKSEARVLINCVLIKKKSVYVYIYICVCVCVCVLDDPCCRH